MDSGEDQNPVNSTLKPKNKTKKPFVIIILLVVLVLLGFGAWKTTSKDSGQSQTSASEEVLPIEGSGTMGVSSDVQQVTVGEVATFKIYVDSGETPVNAVGVRASYPTDTFELVDIDYTGSKFTIQAKEEVKNGNITLDRATGIDTTTKVGSSLTGESLVATITLKAIKPSTESELTLNEGSILIEASTSKNILKTWQGAKIKVIEE